VTHLRQLMLEELRRRNYSESTMRASIRTVEHFAGHFHRPPDQRGLEHIRKSGCHVHQVEAGAEHRDATSCGSALLLYPGVEARPECGRSWIWATSSLGSVVTKANVSRYVRSGRFHASQMPAKANGPARQSDVEDALDGLRRFAFRAGFGAAPKRSQETASGSVQSAGAPVSSSV
jgi:hypothetical protein